MQLAQTVEGITHLVEVPVSALGYLPSTLVYTQPITTSSWGPATGDWSAAAGGNGVGVAAPATVSAAVDAGKFSDIVSASIEAIGFPESVQPGSQILSQAEQILIASGGLVLDLHTIKLNR